MTEAAASRIIVNAHRINADMTMATTALTSTDSDFHLIRVDTPEAIHERLLRMVTERIAARFGLDPVRDVQVLTPKNRGGLGARALNVALQAALNPEAQPRIERFGWTYAPGGKVIQLVNDYDKAVFNGDIGRIRAIGLDEGLLTIDFDGRPSSDRPVTAKGREAAGQVCTKHLTPAPVAFVENPLSILISSAGGSLSRAARPGAPPCLPSCVHCRPSCRYKDGLAFSGSQPGSAPPRTVNPPGKLIRA